MTILIAVLVLSASSALYFQPHLMFHPVAIPQDYKFNFDLPFEEKFISYGEDSSSKSEKQIHALLFSIPSPKCRLLYFHGNGSSLDTWGLVGEELAQKLKCQVLIIDYPGFGKSSQSVPSSEKELFQSSRAALDFFIKETQNTSTEKLPLVLYGRSLGTGMVTWLALEPSVRAIILEAPYLSIKAMAGLMVPIVPSFMVRYDIDNKKNLQALKESETSEKPILLFHGTQDQLIPIAHAEELMTVVPQAQLVSIEGGDHNNLPIYPQYWAELLRFMSSLDGTSVTNP